MPRSPRHTTSIPLRVSRCALLPSPGCAGPSSPRSDGPISSGNQLTVDSSATIVRRDGESWVDDVATKTGNRRTLTLDPATVDAIDELRVNREQVSPYLFSDTTGPANPDRIGWWWTRAREQSGIDRKWRLHDLRHWTATTAITSGHDVRTVAGRLGHANPAMTLRVYAHAVEGADRALAGALGDALKHLGGE